MALPEGESTADQIRLYRGLSGLESLKDPWRALVARLERPSYVHFWEWHCSYLEAGVFEPDSVIFCAAFDGEQARVILPLVRSRKHVLGLPVRMLGLPLAPLTPHADIVVDPRALPDIHLPSILEALRGRLREPWDVVRLGLTSEQSFADDAMRPLRGRAASGLLLARQRRDTSTALVLAPYEEMFARFSKSLRGSLRNGRNRLAKLDGITFRQARDPGELEEAFVLICELEAAGWKGRRGTAIRSDPRRQAMYNGFVRHFGRIGHCRIDLLMHGERAVAGLLSLRAGDRVFAFKIAYDESYKREAPGKMLLERVVQELGDDPAIVALDLISDQEWIHGWRPERRDMFLHHLCRRTPAGMLFWLQQRSVSAVRALLRD